jgi:hypothetical protein
MAPESILVPPPRQIASREVWTAARVHGLYGMSTVELKALVTRHGDSMSIDDRVVVEAARHVHNLRRGMAAGGACC